MKKLWMAVLLVVSLGTVCLAADKAHSKKPMAPMGHGDHKM